MIRTTLLATTIGTAFLLTAPVHAGGPVILEGEEPPLVAGNTDRKPNILPVLIGIGILALIAGSGGGSSVPGAICNGDDTPTTPGC